MGYRKVKEIVEVIGRQGESLNGSLSPKAVKNLFFLAECLKSALAGYILKCRTDDLVEDSHIEKKKACDEI